MGSSSPPVSSGIRFVSSLGEVWPQPQAYRHCSWQPLEEAHANATLGATLRVSTRAREGVQICHKESQRGRPGLHSWACSSQPAMAVFTLLGKSQVKQEGRLVSTWPVFQSILGDTVTASPQRTKAEGAAGMCRDGGRIGELLEGSLEWLGLFPKPHLVSSHRCEENCLSCEGSSRNCSKCKTGFTQLGTSCITNHTCSNGEPQSTSLWSKGKTVMADP